MTLENRTDRALVDMAENNPALGFAGMEARETSDESFMKKNNITRQSHERRDMGLDVRDYTYVTVWV
jgi:hypothetical protein